MEVISKPYIFCASVVHVSPLSCLTAMTKVPDGALGTTRPGCGILGCVTK